MKRYFYSLLILTCIIFLSNCSKTDFSIRINNQYFEEIDNIIIDNIYSNGLKFGFNLGNLSVGQKSGYKPIEKGDHLLFGLTITGKRLEYKLKLDGSGTHKFTITVQQTGDITISQDN